MIVIVIVIPMRWNVIKGWKIKERNRWEQRRREKPWLGAAEEEERNFWECLEIGNEKGRGGAHARKYRERERERKGCGSWERNPNDVFSPSKVEVGQPVKYQSSVCARREKPNSSGFIFFIFFIPVTL